MSGQLLVFAGSLAGILFLVLLSYALGLGRDARIADAREARELADNAICGFEARDIAIDAAGRGALLQDGAGRILLLAPHGVNFAARLLERATRTTREGGRLIIFSADPTFPVASLELGAVAGTWERRLKALDS